MRYIGVDLAWGEGTATKAAKETGLVCLDDSGTVLDAGWARGIDAVVEWLLATAKPGEVIAIDAPLVVANPTGMRECEREVAQRYGRWQVAANPSNLGRPWFGGVTLRQRLEAVGFVYSSGVEPPSPERIQFFECYPYTTLVGAIEFGYDIERPRYKRFNPALPNPAARRAFRASECDELVERMSRLIDAQPSLDLRSHPVTADLLDSPSPLVDALYKHREDLLDAAICAWTAALWAQFGDDRCQVLGLDDVPDDEGRLPVIIAPARPEQRQGRATRTRVGSSVLSHSALLGVATTVLKQASTSDSDPRDFEVARRALMSALAEVELRRT
jgi:predicted RNase H-like nuclease